MPDILRLIAYEVNNVRVKAGQPWRRDNSAEDTRSLQKAKYVFTIITTWRFACDRDNIS